MFNSAFERLSINSYAEEDELVQQEIYKIKIIVLGATSANLVIKIVVKVPSSTNTPNKEIHNFNHLPLALILYLKLFKGKALNAIYRSGILLTILVHRFPTVFSIKQLVLLSCMILLLK